MVRNWARLYVTSLRVQMRASYFPETESIQNLARAVSVIFEEYTPIFSVSTPIFSRT